jgi:hypothetical protein
MTDEEVGREWARVKTKSPPTLVGGGYRWYAGGDDLYGLPIPLMTAMTPCFDRALCLDYPDEAAAFRALGRGLRILHEIVHPLSVAARHPEIV